MRFLVFSDLHLDHELDGDDPQRATRRRADLRACLDRLLALADAHDVDAILSAGNLYEQRHVRPGTADLLVDRLGQAARPVFLAPGDADPHTPESLYATTAWPANVHVFDHDLLVPVDLGDGFRLWGAAHVGHPDTPGFLDGFRITDEAVGLALFHGAEVAGIAPVDAHDSAPVPAPFRADQVERSGLAHAFVGHAHAVDATWHTSPGTPHPLGDEVDDDLRGAVIVDVAPDGSVRRQRFDVASSPVHEVVIDLAGAASTDEVLERMLESVEDLHGTVHVSLHGDPAPDVVVDDDELTSWSTAALEIVLDPPPQPTAPPEPVAPPEPAAPLWSAAPPPARDVQRPSTVAQPEPLDTPEPPEPLDPPHSPSVEVVREVTAAHTAWQDAIARLHRHAVEEPATVERPDLGGLDLDTVAAHLETLQGGTSALEPDPATEASAPEGAPARREPRSRTIARAAAALVTVSSAIGLLVIGERLLLRGVAVAALVMVGAMVLNTRRRDVEDREQAEARARARRTLHTMELSTELARQRHEAVAALQQAGLPAHPDELAALLDQARTAQARAEVRQGTRAGWDMRRADLLQDLVEATARLRAALRRGGIAETMDVEVDLARFQARVERDPRMLPARQPSTSGTPAGVG